MKSKRNVWLFVSLAAIQGVIQYSAKCSPVLIVLAWALISSPAWLTGLYLAFSMVALVMIAEIKQIGRTESAMNSLERDLARLSTDFHILHVSNTDLVKQILTEAGENYWDMHFGRVFEHVQGDKEDDEGTYNKPIVFAIVTKEGVRRANVPAASYNVLGVLAPIVVYRHRPGPVTAGVAFELAHELAHSRLCGQMTLALHQHRDFTFFGYLVLLPVIEGVSLLAISTIWLTHYTAMRALELDEVIADRFAFSYLVRRYSPKEWLSVIHSKREAMLRGPLKSFWYRMQRCRGLSRMLQESITAAVRGEDLKGMARFSDWSFRKVTLNIWSFNLIGWAPALCIILLDADIVVTTFCCDKRWCGSGNAVRDRTWRL